MSRKFKVVLFLVLLFAAWIFIAPLLANLLIVEKPLEKADVILVLGGSSTYLERTQKAAELYKEKIASKIFLTNDGQEGGWSKIEKRNPPFFELAKRELISQGVAENNIEILPDVVEGTNYEADLFAKIAKERNLKSILLVTSAYHSRRAIWTFQRAVIKNDLSVEVGIQTPLTGQQTPPPFSWWLNRRGWMLVGEEYVKMAYYWLFY